MYKLIAGLAALVIGNTILFTYVPNKPAVSNPVIDFPIKSTQETIVEKKQARLKPEPLDVQQLGKAQGSDATVPLPKPRPKKVKTKQIDCKVVNAKRPTWATDSMVSDELRRRKFSEQQIKQAIACGIRR